MKVIGSSGSSKKTVSQIDLELSGLSKDVQDDIKEEVGQFLVEQVLLAMGSASSPVVGESFPGLSAAYKKKKIALGGSPSANLELSGDLKDALTFEPTSEGIEIGFFGSEADKADGHLKFSGRENFTPQRRFLPEEGQNFKRDIVQGVQEIVDSKLGDEFSKSDFSGVESSTELYDVLREVYGGYSRSEVREAVASNSSLMDILIDLDLVGFL